jgi:hypothetical protein
VFERIDLVGGINFYLRKVLKFLDPRSTSKAYVSVESTIEDEEIVFALGIYIIEGDNKDEAALICSDYISSMECNVFGELIY